MDSPALIVRRLVAGFGVVFIAIAMLVGAGGPAAAFGPGLLAKSAVDVETAIKPAQFFWPFRDQRRRLRRAPKRRGAGQPAQKRIKAVPSGEDKKLAGERKDNENATRIVVFGDSVAKDLWAGMVKSLGQDDSFEVLRKTKVSSGMVRDDFYDWQKAVAAAQNEGRIDIAVWMIGINDLQKLRTGGGRFEPDTPEWVEAYKARVDAVIKALTAKGTAVYWVGLPIVRSPRLTKGYTRINAIVRERVELLGARFVDIWNGFADENGAYSAYGPDIAGARRKMRKGNGIHFSSRGNEKLVLFVEQAIKGDLAGSGTTLDGRRVIRQGAQGGLVISSGSVRPSGADDLAGALDPSDNVVLSLARPSRSALPTAAPGQPMMLNSPQTATGKTDGEEVVSPLFTVLMRGEALAPKPGRADDFAWDEGQ
ncbi:hypothetical protein MNBD_ALPHA09-1217 [hydrothermal vent metagenome]|uniref:SGNH hydrolase-type esterase domain-containing protein n=1 Tax=hydrothermal vent metagenome TaxID=652676 RepID=A0A3B0T1I8_9ZZZZ